MKKVSKSVFFIVLALLIGFGYLTLFGASTRYGDVNTTVIKGVADIRWGIDIRGGVDVTFMPADDIDATAEQMRMAEDVIRTRLLSLNITDSEVYTDLQKNRVIVRFPWKAGETDFDPEQAIAELGQTSYLTFRPYSESDAEGRPAGATAATVLLEGKHVQSAQASVNTQTGAYFVSLKLNSEGTQLFAEATADYVGQVISIWMDDEMISAATVQSVISGGEAAIEGDFNVSQVTTLARQINSGALPFKLETENFSIISPSLGMGARDAMVKAGVIAFMFIAVFMLAGFRLPGFVAVLSLAGQVILMLAGITGFIAAIPSFTLTLPGIAGIILSMGFGVDCNIITASRIREEMAAGRTLDNAIYHGYKRALSAVLDSNITVFIVAIVLMGGFGTPDSLFVKIFSVVLFMFGPSTAGAIYSFGYTLLVGVIANMVMGVLVSQLMLKSLSRFDALRNPAFYGSQQSPKRFGVDFIGKRKLFFTASLLVLALALVWGAIGGVELGIEFRGGTIITYDYDGTLDRGDLQREVQDFIGEGVTIQETEDVATGSFYYVVSLASNKGISAEDQAALGEALHAAFPDNNLTVVSTNVVNPTIGREFLRKSAFVVVLAAVLLVAFIGWRFKNIGGLRAGASAVIAVLHDILVVLAVFIVIGIPIDDNFIAVILFILGYSLNDTVVIFDRMRENRRIHTGLSTAELVNMSINQCLSRSIATTITTVTTMCVVTVVAMISNVDSILSFSFPMIIGMLSGVYSSVCIAGPIWVQWQSRNTGKAAK